MTFAVVMPVGPGELELERVTDTLVSLHHFEPGVGRVILVDDAETPRPDALRDTAGALVDRTTVRRNPRDRSTEGWSEGVMMGTATGLDEVVRGTPGVEWALKLDSDAVVIGRFADAIGARFASDPGLGLLGRGYLAADGSDDDITMSGRPIRRLHQPVSVWKAQRRMRTTLFGVGRQRRAVIDAACANGYLYGQHCQGGAYAMPIDTIRAVAARGWLDGRLWTRTAVAEDVVMGVQVAALGRRMADMSGPGEPFAVRHVGLPGNPRELVAAGHAIAHSVKAHGSWTEDALRDEFRTLRA
jgi:hypothetical protein